jgi:hypothetical protein
MIDWMTLILELTGLAILCAWFVVPIREFGTILRRLRRRAGTSPDPAPLPPADELTGS